MENETSYPLSEEDFRAALQEMSTYMDITEEDLYKIYKIALKHNKLRMARSIPVESVMTKEIYSITPDATLNDAAKILSEKHISALPVIDNNSKLVGLISDGDFLIVLQDEHEQSIWETLGKLIKGEKTKSHDGNKVSDLMTKEVITVHKEDDVHIAVDLMIKHKIKRVIVVGDENKVVGLLSRADIIQLFLKDVKE